ncbi:MAG: hypothetical protein PHQ85_00260 [Eubacteriales bacterium]|jgi:Gpi18-like mannosyltransferase|nr:hypothetical protein [Eubacteriales bacterium]MDD4104395.1 hypothetical protein [Eubacteriales bacterium]MDD4709658.1 hypothetical protein [Eubacteriales bacterium]NLO15713.1 hypothetical protein [Clostridiales bacterium]
MKRSVRNCALLLITACVLLYLSIHLLQGSSPLRTSNYNTYVLQAMRWRQGAIALQENVAHLELAVFEGKYFVSFPPVPTLPIFLLTFLFGENVPDALLVQLYSLGACLLFFVMLSRRMTPEKAAALSLLGCFGSSLLALMQDGAVWYQAQTLALLLMAASLERMDTGKPTTGLLFYALSVGCRPFNALYGPLLMMLYTMRQDNLKTSLNRMAPGILLGLGVALLLGAYNYARFGQILEFGHNYLPEFSTQGGTQFSLKHIANNATTFLWGSPVQGTDTGGWELKKFGFSLFLANPLLLCLVLWAVRDTIQGTMTTGKTLTAIVFLIHATLLMSHRTGGGYQYGARYWVDCLPYGFLYLSQMRKGQWGIIALLPMGMGLVMAVYGASVIRLPL